MLWSNAAAGDTTVLLAYALHSSTYVCLIRLSNKLCVRLAPGMPIRPKQFASDRCPQAHNPRRTVCWVLFSVTCQPREQAIDTCTPAEAPKNGEDTGSGEKGEPETLVGIPVDIEGVLQLL